MSETAEKIQIRPLTHYDGPEPREYVDIALRG